MPVPGASPTPPSPFTLKYPASTVASLAAYWVTTTSALLAFEREHARSCLRVRSEDLAHGEQAEERITAFLGLPSAAVRPIPGSPGEPRPGSADAEPTTDPPVGLMPPALLAQVNELHGQLDYQSMV